VARVELAEWSRGAQHDIWGMIERERGGPVRDGGVRAGAADSDRDHRGGASTPRPGRAPARPARRRLQARGAGGGPGRARIARPLTRSAQESGCARPRHGVGVRQDARTRGPVMHDHDDAEPRMFRAQAPGRGPGRGTGATVRGHACPIATQG